MSECLFIIVLSKCVLVTAGTIAQSCCLGSVCACVVPKVQWDAFSTLADLLFPMELIKVLRTLEPVVEEWYMLGLHLGLSVNMMRTIEKDYPAIAQRKMSMVQRWMSAPQLSPSWCSLVKALRNVGLNTAAGEISKEYSKCSVTSSHCQGCQCAF